jgi:pilus assembly protein CpaB
VRSAMRRRWSTASRAFLALAVLLGGAAFLLVRGYAARVDALAPAIGQSVPVVTAARNLVRGTTLDAQMLSLSAIPAAYAPPGALRSVEAAVGRTTVSDLAEGEPLTRTRLGTARVGPVANLVPPGLRAVTLPVAAADGISAGDHVDVLATFGGGQPHTEMPASDVDVIRVGAGTSGAPSLAADAASQNGGTITVLVTPSDAQSLAYASTFATLSVSILGPPERTGTGN